MSESGLRLVPFHRKHFTALAGWFADERAAVQWGGGQVHFPVDHSQLEAMLDDGLRRSWMVARGEALVGHAQLGFDGHNRVGRLGRVAIAPEARGQGLAAPMLALVLEQARTCARVELEVYSFNTAAIRAYQRAGFIIEGVRRSAVAVGDERWDSVLMARVLQDDGPRGDAATVGGAPDVVALAPVTRANVRAVCDLRLAEHQRGLVAPAAYTAAEGMHEPGALLRAVLADDEVVGVAGVETESGTPYLVRFMVDALHQGQGIGRRAVDALCAELAAAGWPCVECSYVAAERGVAGFWARCGFVSTGRRTDDGEPIAMRPLSE